MGPLLLGSGPMVVDSDTMAQRVEAYLELDLEPEHSRRTFYTVACTLSQVSSGEPMPPEAKFWDPCIMVSYGLRNAAKLFELKLARHSRALPSRGNGGPCPRVFLQPLVVDPKLMSSKSSEFGSVGTSRPSQHSNMLHVAEGEEAVGEEDENPYPIP